MLGRVFWRWIRKSSTYTSIHVYLRVGFLSCYTLTLLDNQVVLKPRSKTFLMLHYCVLRCTHHSSLHIKTHIGRKSCQHKTGFWKSENQANPPKIEFEELSLRGKLDKTTQYNDSILIDSELGKLYTYRR